MLLSGRRCEYIVAFNGSIPMDSIAPPETFALDGVEHAVVDLRGQQTYGEVVIRWLDVIYQNVDGKTFVRLIGTHLDKVGQLIGHLSLNVVLFSNNIAGKRRLDFKSAWSGSFEQTLNCWRRPLFQVHR